MNPYEVVGQAVGHVIETHPQYKVLLTHMCELGFDRELDVILGLEDVKTVEHGDKAQQFEWECQVIIYIYGIVYDIEQYICITFRDGTATAKSPTSNMR